MDNDRKREPYIFACFDYSDAERVFPIIRRLSDAGWRVSYDETEAGIGAPSSSVIRRVKECTVFLLFISERCEQNRRVIRLASLAVSSGKEIIKYSLDGNNSFANGGSQLNLSGESPLITDRYTLEDTLYGIKELTRVHYAVSDAEEASAPKSDSMFGFGDDIFAEAEMPMTAAESAEPEYEYGVEPPAPYIPPSVPRPAAVPAPAPAPSMPSASVPASPSAAQKKPVKVKVDKINKVDFSVVTDDAVKPGNSSVIDVFMYTKGQRHIVDKILSSKESKKTEAVKSVSKVAVRQGSTVTVLITSDDAGIANGSESLIWSGDLLDFKFRFSLPEGYKKKQAEFACEILFDGIHISRLYFVVKLSDAKLVPVRFVRKDSRRAFVSYSHKDRQQVVSRLAEIQSVAPKLRFWMDNQSMNAGELWRNAIASAIKKSDVFLLFWSNNSKNSAEVEKEWRYALDIERSKSRRKNGANFITPVPLEKPSVCPPPKELENRHFGDPSFDSDIDRISDIRFIADGEKPRNIRFF